MKVNQQEIRLPLAQGRKQFRQRAGISGSGMTPAVELLYRVHGPGSIRTSCFWKHRPGLDSAKDSLDSLGQAVETMRPAFSFLGQALGHGPKLGLHLVEPERKPPLELRSSGRIYHYTLAPGAPDKQMSVVEGIVVRYKGRQESALRYFVMLRIALAFSWFLAGAGTTFGDAAPQIIRARVRQLVGSLKSRDKQERISALQGIAEIGPQAEGAIPALLDTLFVADQQIALEAKTALIEVGPAAIPKVLDLMEKEHLDERELERVSGVLWQLGPLLAVHRDRVLKLLHHMDEEVRAEVISLLHQVIGKDVATHAIAMLKKRQFMARPQQCPEYAYTSSSWQRRGPSGHRVHGLREGPGA